MDKFLILLDYQNQPLLNSLSELEYWFKEFPKSIHPVRLSPKRSRFFENWLKTLKNELKKYKSTPKALITEVKPDLV